MPLVVRSATPIHKSSKPVRGAPSFVPYGTSWEQSHPVAR